MSKRVVNSSGSRILMQAGVPMIIFIVGGSVGLSAFMQTHYELKDKKLNTQTVRNYDLAAEHAAMMKKLNVENFTLSRIPRPEELVAASALRNEKKKEKEARWAPKTVYTGRPEKAVVNDKVPAAAVAKDEGKTPDEIRKEISVEEK